MRLLVMRSLIFVLALSVLSGCCINPSTIMSLLPFFLKPDFKAEIEATDPESMPKVFTPFCGHSVIR